MKRLLVISRPRFWVYLFGPFLVGTASVFRAGVEIDVLQIILLFAFFTFPANLLLYGINDVFDWETDRMNKKKQGYESLMSESERKGVVTFSMMIAVGGMVISIWTSLLTGLIMFVFLFLSIFYSAPPVRAKVIPFFDSAFNGLYIMPGVIAYVALTGSLPGAVFILAGWLWSAAMHAYSAVPDIEADRRANIATIATRLGANNTLIACTLLYGVSATLVLFQLPLFAFVGGTMYVAMMIVSMRVKQHQLLSIYKLFPWINTAFGMGLFFTIVF